MREIEVYTKKMDIKRERKMNPISKGECGIFL